MQQNHAGALINIVYHCIKNNYIFSSTGPDSLNCTHYFETETADDVDVFNHA